MVAPAAIIGALFRAGKSVIPVAKNISKLANSVNEVAEAYRLAEARARGFYEYTIGANKELEDASRRSAVSIATQVAAFGRSGQEITDITEKITFFRDRIQEIQVELQEQTKDIVGATDVLTQAIFNNSTLLFSELQGQTKNFADDLEAIQKLTVNLTTAFATFDIPVPQVPQEIRALLQGDINNPDARLARILRDTQGFTKEVFREAAANGELIDKLIESTEGLFKANAEGLNTLSNSYSNIVENVQLLGRSLGEGPIRGLEEGLANLLKVFNELQGTEAIVNFGREVGAPIGQALENIIERFAGLLQKLAEDGTLDNVGDALIGLTTIGAKFVELLAKLGNFLIKITAQFVSFLTTIGKTIKQLADLRASLTNFASFIGIDVDFNIPTSDEVKKEIQNVIDAVAEDIDTSQLLTLSSDIRRSEVVDDFRANITMPLEDELARLRAATVTADLDAAIIEDIDAIINAVDSFDDIKDASAEISKILTEVSSGGQYQGFFDDVDKLDSSISALKAKQEEIEDILQGGRSTEKDKDEMRLREINKRLEEQLNVRKEIAVNLDPQIAKQRQLIEDAEREGKVTQEMTDKLFRMVEARKKNFEAITFGRKEAVDFGSAFVASFTNFDQTLEAIVNATARDLPRAVKSLLADLDSAIKLGSVSNETAIQSLSNLINVTTLQAEERVQIFEKINQLINQQRIQQAEVFDLEKRQFELQVAKGEIISDQAELSKLGVDIKEAEFQLQQEISKLNALDSLQQAGTKDQLEQKLILLETEASLLEGNAKVQKEQEIAEVKELQALLEGGSAARDRLNTEILLKETKLETLKLSEQDLKFQQSLDFIAEKRADAELRIATAVAQTAAAYDEALFAGEASLAQVERQAKLTAEQQAQQQLLIADINLKEQQALLEESSALSIDRQLEQKREVLNAERELAEAQSAYAQAAIVARKADIDYLVARKSISLEIIKAQFDLANQADAVNKKFNDNILAQKAALLEFNEALGAVEASLQQIQIGELESSLTGLDRIAKLQSDLTAEQEKGAQANQDRVRALNQAINATEKVFGISKADANNLKVKLETIKEIGEIERQQIENQSQLERENLELEQASSLFALTVANQELQAANDLLDIKKDELSIEQEKIKLRQLSGELDLDQANKLLDINRQSIELLDREKQANDETAKINDQKVDQNQLIFNKKQQIVNEEEKSKLNNQSISQSLREQDLVLDSIVSDTAAIANNTELTLGASQSGGSFSGGNIFGVEFDDFLDDYNAITEKLDNLTANRVQSTIGPGADAFFEEFDALAAEAQKEYVKAEIRYQEALAEARREFQEEARGRGTISKGFLSSGITNEPIEQIETEDLTIRGQINTLLDELRLLSLQPQTEDVVGRIASISDQIDELIQVSEDSPEVLAIQNRLRELNQLERTEAVILEIFALTEQLKLLTEAQEQSVTPTTLLEALNSGQFQAGAFNPQNDGTLLIDPETGEIIVSGTRPNFEELNLLFDANELSRLQLEELKGINANLSTTFDEQLDNQLALTKIAEQNLDQAAQIDNLLRADLLSETDANILKTASNLSNQGSISGQAGTLAQGGFISSEDAALFNLKQVLESSELNQAGKEAFVKSVGFNSIADAQQAINLLPDLNNLINDVYQKASLLPDLNDLINAALSFETSLGSFNLTGVSANTLELELGNTFSQPQTTQSSQQTFTTISQSSGSGSGGTSFQAFNTQSSEAVNVTNNYYPSQTGTTSSILASAGL